MWSTIMIFAGIILTLTTVCLTLLLSYKKDKQKKISLWLKSISIIAACLALCAAGAVINVLSVRVHIQGDNNSVSLQFAEGNIENAPGSALIEDIPSPDYDTVDDFIVGWADSNGGREAYTLDQVNSGKLDSSIVFNSISDGSFGHEFNFVGARENNGETIDYWNANEIEAEEGKTYTVRLFAHNNSRVASNVAEDVLIDTADRLIEYSLGLAGSKTRAGQIQKEGIRRKITQQYGIVEFLLKLDDVVTSVLDECLVYFLCKFIRTDMCCQTQRSYRYCFNGIIICHMIYSFPGNASMPAI